MDSGNVENHADTFKFPCFDVVHDATDHHFLLSNNSAKANMNFNNGASSVYRTIMKEWKILRENLPESIYVRVYETRIDLLRAVIIGSPGTPYHDGLFFFDICLPFDYPKQPPKVHYRSHGYRLNPNLYSDGTVCLSLINTWVGTKDEKWTKKSTILQTLVSIQGLVLNERPYFNEPGYEDGKDSMSPFWVDNSVEYNQNTFILSCQTMIGIVRKPPQNFEGFVDRHFRARAGLILAAVREYEEGRAMVGKFRTNEECRLSSVKVASIFKDKLNKIHSELLIAFSPFVGDADHATNVVKPKENVIAPSPLMGGPNMDADHAMNVVKPKENVIALSPLMGGPNMDDDHATNVVKPKENVKKNKKGILSKLAWFANCIWE